MINKKGMTLVTVIAIFSICLLLIVALIGITSSAYRSAVSEHNMQQAYETAHSVSEYIGQLISDPNTGYNNGTSDVRKMIDAVPMGTAPTKNYEVDLSKADGSAVSSALGETSVGMYRFDNGDGLPPELRVLVTTTINGEERSLLTRYQGNAPGGSVNPEIARILLGYSIYTNAFTDLNGNVIPIDNLEPTYHFPVNDPTPEIVEDNQYVYDDYIKKHYICYGESWNNTLHVNTYSQQSATVPNANIPLYFEGHVGDFLIDTMTVIEKFNLVFEKDNNYSKKVFEFKARTATNAPGTLTDLQNTFFRIMSREAGADVTKNNYLKVFDKDNNLVDYVDKYGKKIEKINSTYPIKIKTSKAQMYPWIIPETPALLCKDMIDRDAGNISADCVLDNTLDAGKKVYALSDHGPASKNIYLVGASNKPITLKGLLKTSTDVNAGLVNLFIVRDPKDPNPKDPIKVDMDGFQFAMDLSSGVDNGHPAYIISNEKLDINVHGPASLTAFLYLPNSKISFKTDAIPTDKAGVPGGGLINRHGTGNMPNVSGGIIADRIEVDNTHIGNNRFEMVYFQPRDSAALNLKVAGGYMAHTYIKTGTGKVVD